MIPASPGGIIGPGLRLDLNAGLTQPTTPSTVWDVEVTTGEPAVHIWSKRYTSQANPFRWWPWVNDEPTGLPLQGVAVPTGTNVQVAATVQIAGGGAADASGTANFTWQAEAGIPAVISTQTGGGMTSEEHGWLDQVQQFINNTAALAGRLGTQTLAGGIIEHPDVGLMHPCDAPMTLTGSGSLQRSATLIGVNAYGLVLTVVSSPPGAGRFNGVFVEYSSRVAQLTTLFKAIDGSDVYPTEFLELREERLAWVWKSAFPESITYFVTPGYTLQAQWLCVTFPV